MDNFFEELDQEIYHLGGSWTCFLIRALWPHTNGMSRKDTQDFVIEDALDRGRRLPVSFSDVIQSTFQKHNSGSNVFCGDPNRDIFRFVGKKGSGFWALNREAALIWMANNGRAADFSIKSIGYG